MFAPYIWGGGLDGATSIGPVTSEIDLSFGDILETLDEEVVHHRAGLGLGHRVVTLGVALDRIDQSIIDRGDLASVFPVDSTSRSTLFSMTRRSVAMRLTSPTAPPIAPTTG
jgi:hypothetical protein